ncbi:DsrE family protein [Peptoniphilus harei]|uniref:DsrE family protein n=1 Tax=Peptoniphilus harei TaxID=54005 RepID=A0A943XZQ1_9FIRM|nr:DsrE family protein [Peptoniphilus harei]MBS6534618.1 DsrE family protein [Peptoniphilus harei]
MEKILFYVMEGEKMCFNHAMLNAEALLDADKEVKIILEGKSVKLPKILEEEKNPLYKKLLESGVIVGVCKACSKVLGVYDDNERLGLTLLDDMKGHAGMEQYVAEGYQVVVF